MKKQIIRYASAALLSVGFAMGGASAGNAASPIVAGAMAASAKAVAAAQDGAPALVPVVDRDDYFRRPNPYTTPGDRGYYESSKNVWYRNHQHRKHNYRHRHYRNRGGSGVFFSFGGRGGGFSFGVAPRPRYYRAVPRYGYPQVQSSAHVRWCYSRYRSYRQRDNTFQPYHGPRKQCISPYY